MRKQSAVDFYPTEILLARARCVLLESQELKALLRETLLQSQLLREQRQSLHADGTLQTAYGFQEISPKIANAAAAPN